MSAKQTANAGGTRRPSPRLTSVSCSSLRIVYFRIFCRLRLIKIPTATTMIRNSRTPTTVAMMNVTGLETKPESEIGDYSEEEA